MTGSRELQTWLIFCVVFVMMPHINHFVKLSLKLDRIMLSRLTLLRILGHQVLALYYAYANVFIIFYDHYFTSSFFQTHFLRHF